ncbi:MAG: PEPxxWA-CTERM sorting domain-containing protein [Proteobacteria bacterium]|nr:PEPxxWA-CTERM sorting domain-containing protein [Pseudomonadota bacterium]
MVPLHLVGAILVSESQSAQNAGGTATASFEASGWSDPNGGDFSVGFSCSFSHQSGCVSESFSHDFTVAAWADGLSGNIISFNLQAQAQVDAANEFTIFGTNGGEVGATAFVDPMVTIDADWLADNPGFQLNWSNGVENGTGLLPSTGGVPEPATWALMIAGFGLAGASLRRRRAAAA